MENEAKSHRDLSDEEFISLFENCSLDPSLFSHEAHLRLAWIILQKMDLNEAVIKIQHDILRFVDFVGAKDKYNVTLTVAAVHIIHQLI